MNRRDFLKTAGTAAAAASVVACGVRTEENTGKKTLGSMSSNMEGISLLGYGCMRWPASDGENGEKVIDQEAVNSLVDRAIQAGVNYFDTAPLYIGGKSEQATANALLRYPRQSYRLATKCSNYKNLDYPIEEGVNMYRHSLEVFKTDYIDYYLFHCLTGFEDFRDRFIGNGLLDFFLEERKAGRIRHLGWSYHGDREGFDRILELHSKYHWDFVQIQMNYVDWKHTDGDVEAEHMYRELDRLEIPVIIMEPLLGGRLSEVPSAVSRLLKGREPQSSIASWAFRFCGSFPRILTVLSGMTYMEHLEDNLDTFCNFRPLSEEDFTLLEQAAVMIKEFPTVGCTGCQYCMPCPYGINIPGIFKFYNSNITDGTYAVNAAQKNYGRIKRRYLLEYNKALPTVRQADHCTGCQICETRCPQGIDIASQMRRIDRYIEDLKQDKL
ncbi:MAG: aldo/keto reductase [Bacteroidales bacterium]|nr:aldo/keto reductase [Bacteroidales bacterium]